MAALITVEEFFQYVKQPLPADTDDKYKLVESLIYRASDYCREYVGGPIITESITEKIDGTGHDEIKLSKVPVLSVSSVVVDGVDKTAAIGFYEFGILYMDDVFPEGRQNVTVNYSSGYGATHEDIPQGIKQAALLICHYWFKRDTLDYSSTYGESEVITGQWRFPTTALKMLDPYKVRKMAVI
ncbi:hypothetical protein ACFO25_09925 [Paenactinomyces guangxiensis]|uniref:Phage gp6-like head-tail connector protein n=1 Tax=Paenactinomyces guangxiensis TaxID=1490290 RepID=A0A7W1WS62_9BACL|nr:hypothetical protein [Paenactinomyces guangxiensis]MBA4495102.1 hypothetical protein [Paenactinomyces guangxiensis]MBH8592214.1 hypothetical protein [Paenactinomyces guangxiensis]